MRANVLTENNEAIYTTECESERINIFSISVSAAHREIVIILEGLPRSQPRLILLPNDLISGLCPRQKQHEKHTHSGCGEMVLQT